MKPGSNHSGGNRGGFTLVELMVAVVVLAIVFAGIYNIYIHMHKTWLTEDIKAGMQQNARVAMDNLVREMMMMGYGASENDKKITIAEASVLEFKVHMKDYKGATPNLYSVKYILDGDELKRKVVACIADNSDAVSVANILDTDYNKSYNPNRTLAESVKTLSFAYYDADGNEMVPPGGTDDQTTERDKIRRIRITVKVESDKLPGTTVKKEMTLTADLSPRNLWEGEVGYDLIKPAGVSATDVLVRDARKVEPENSCGNGVLKVKWAANADSDLAGYLIKWGTATGSYTHYKDVPASNNEPITETSHPTQTEISDGIDYTPYYSSDGTLNKYYVVVQVYDRSHNYSDFNVATDEVVATAPDPDETDFDTGSTDSSCDLPKPLPPSGFEVRNSQTDEYCPNKQARLVWTKPSDPNVIGYRIYRSYTTISLSGPMEPDGVVVKEIAKETANGGTLDYNSESFIDNDSSLVSCDTYHYAICSVTCDTSRILGGPSEPYHDGGRYGASEYALASGEPYNSSPPANPGITAQAGWQRVFLQMQWPMDNDYEYTKIYFKAGSSDQYDLPGTLDPLTGERTFTEPDELIPHHQTGYPRGTFYKDGTSAANTIIFNSEVEALGGGAQPTLDNNKNYTFVAVSYNKCGQASSQTEFATTFAELCGDDPCGAPRWSTADADSNPLGQPFIYVNEAATQKDASLWTLNSETLEIEAPLGLKWGDVVKTDPDTALDFFGYTVKRRVNGTSSWTDPVSTGEWNNYVIDTISEGATYDFCVQAADCAYHNMTQDDTVCCPEKIQADGSCSDPKTYDWVVTQKHNITADDKGPTAADSYYYVKWTTVSPGRIKLDSAPAITEGEFHNKVKLYIRNTSKSTLTIRNMRLAWGNTAARLKYVTIGGGTAVTPQTAIDAGLLANGSLSWISSFQNVQVLDLASAPGSPSGMVPVTLEFANSGGVADETSDMRGQHIHVEFRFRNDTMPNSSGGDGVGSGDYTTDFTTGDLYGVFGNLTSTPIDFTVTRGPAFKFVVQSKPFTPTVAFDVMSTATITTIPVGFPEVGGLQSVTVSGGAGIINSLGNIVSSVEVGSNPARYENISTVVAHYAMRDPETDPETPDPSDLAFTAVTTVKSGGTYRFTMPGDEYVGAWYYFKAYSNLGNYCREPYDSDAYYYYRQLGFDPCAMTPARPEGLGGTPVLMNWSSVTKYTDGLDVPAADTITYDVYRRNGIRDSDSISLLQAGVGSTSYADATYSGYSTMPLVYMVKAKNTCADPGPSESDYSNKLVVCPTGGTGCLLDVYPRDIYAGEDITVSLAVCEAAWNKSGGQTGSLHAVASSGRDDDYFTITEAGDTGTGTLTFATTSDSALQNPSTLLIIPSGQVSDTITISLSGSLAGAGSCESAVVNAYINPCDNIPSAPTGLTGGRNGKNVTLTWNEVTTNTDATDAIYPTDGSVEDVSYQIWIEVEAGSFALLVDNAGTKSGTTYTANFQAPQSKSYRYFVRAKDKCSSNDADEAASSSSSYITL